MKNLILIFLVAFLVGCSSTKQDWSTIEISGKIEIDDISKIIFYPIETAANDYNNLQEITLKDDGSFLFHYALNKPVNAMIIIGEKQYMFFLDTKNDLILIGKNDSSVEISYETKKNNTVFLDYQTKFSSFFSSSLNYKLNTKKFLYQVDSLAEEKTKFVESQKENISDELYTYFKNDILYYSAKEKIYYARRYANHLIKEDGNYFDFLNSIQIQNNQAENIVNYLGFIDNYINYLYLKKLWGDGVKYKNDYVEKHYIAISELSGITLELFLTENFVLGLQSRLDNENLLELLNQFMSGNYSEKSKNILKQNLDEIDKLAEGNKAPNFSLRNAKNEFFFLSKFNNDYIVCDFWASWCGPCRSTIPKMKILAEKYKDKADFVFISIDQNINHWKTACKQLELPEPSLIIDSLSREDYGIFNNISVPYYMVLDKNGEIILSNTTITKIEQLLD